MGRKASIHQSCSKPIKTRIKRDAPGLDREIVLDSTLVDEYNVDPSGVLSILLEMTKREPPQIAVSAGVHAIALAEGSEKAIMWTGTDMYEMLDEVVVPGVFTLREKLVKEVTEVIARMK
jgi:hypothetical protein